MTGDNAINPVRPLGIGEVVVRVADLGKSSAFYRDMLGFQLIRMKLESIAFIRVANGAHGHTQIIGLFATNGTPTAKARPGIVPNRA